MKRFAVCAAVIYLLGAANSTSAENVRGINIDFVNIGHAGNAPDTQIMWSSHTTGYGAVNYNYSIGKYEITNAQWNAFVSLAGAPTGTGNDGGYVSSPYPNIDPQQPTNYVSRYEAIQFCNWLTSGDKSKGAYQWSGNNVNPGLLVGIDRNAAIATYGRIYVLPTEDEWYKAAYYKPDGTGYSLYSNGTNIAPVAGVNCNYLHANSGFWDIGSGTMEQNGTYDMMGNAGEWSETVVNTAAITRGFDVTGNSLEIGATYRGFSQVNGEYSTMGFRVASIPEPGTIGLLAMGGILIRSRRRKQ